MRLQINDYAGVSLLEVVIVIAAVGFLVLVIAALPTSVSLINQSKNTSIVRDILSQKIDSLRKQGFINLANGKTPFSDPKLTEFSEPTAYYQIDDCLESVCGSGVKIKQVLVHVSWKENGLPKLAEVTTLVSEGGIGQ